ncbi:MAG: hypothetical protein JJU05_02075 [Verrucomicrobia bacterium]|nr:hypothetical protein [Verrucomicrobiota bacterium]MCH8526197.1 hypothetical protein [Kiritimatiellia bacterium]
MPTSRKILHLISQAHLDPVWLWPLRDGIAEVLTTLQSAADRCDEFPQFKFTRSSSRTYEWAKQYDPRLFDRISALIEAGRWEVVGGWVEQPDCNLPSAESFLRQARHGKARFREWFGSAGDTDIGYNVDSFGHAAGLPQLLRLSGFSRYVFMRPQPHDDAEVPLLFQWESPDGSRVLAQRIPGLYAQSYAATCDEVEATVRRAAGEFFAPGFQNGVMWFGVGNHGGGPTRAHIERVLSLQSDDSLPELRFSTLREYFAAAEAEAAVAGLPVLRRELNGVFRGCYSSHGETKAMNRRGETLFFSAEACQYLANRPAPRELDTAWEELLFNQFHDILAGTCTAPNDGETRERYGHSLTPARKSIRQSVFSLARRVDTAGETGSVLFAANPLPWSRTCVVAFDTFKIPHGIFEITHLEAPDGSRVPVQWQHADANLGPWGLPWGKLTAAVELPPCGYRVFRIAGHPVVPKADNSFEAQQAADQQFFRDPETDDPQGPGSRKTPESPVPFRLRVIDDPSGAWGHGVSRYQDDLGAPESFDTRVIEDGGLLSVVRRGFKWGHSEIRVDTVTFAHTRDVELRVRVNWQEQRRMLKISFDTGLTEGRVHTRGAGAWVERTADGNEEPCGEWAGLEDGSGAFVVVSDSLYSCAAEAGRLDLVLARSAPYAEHPPFNYTDDTYVDFLDQGWREIRLWIRRGAEAIRTLHPDRFARECLTPAEIMPDSAHSGDLPRERSGLEIDPDRVNVLALEAAETGDAWHLRLQECNGQSAAIRVDGRELSFRPHEIRSLELPAVL